MKEIIVFCDFDGTMISDIGHAIFEKFGTPKWKEYNQLFKKGIIGSKECLTKQYNLVETTQKQLFSFIKEKKIDRFFFNFYKELLKKGVKLIILSDGGDFYINTILNKYKIKGISFFSNQFKFKGKKIKVNYPYYNEECGKCGNCKTSHLLKFKKNFFIVYIGNGQSDFCPAKKANMVFAKDDLLKFCVQNNITHIEYKNFYEVKKHFSSLFSNN